MQTLPALIAAFSAVTLLHASAPANPRGGPVESIVLVVLDDLGCENIAWWPTGNVLPTAQPMPNLAAFAAQGVTFTRYYTQPLCSPTRAALLTGRYALETGMGINPSDNEQLGTAFLTIPEILKQSPEVHECAAFGKWHLGRVGLPMHPIQTGFDYFRGTFANVHHPTVDPDGDHYSWDRITATPGGWYREHFEGGPVYDESTYSLSVSGADARGWIQAKTALDEPFFAYVCLNVPHGPFQVPPHTMLSAVPPWPAGYEADPNVPGERYAIYNLTLEALDHEFGRLCSVIDFSDTQVIVVGDNGTPGLVAQPGYAGHAKGSVYDAGTRVPLISRGIVCQFPGTVCDEIVSVVDIRPTIAELGSQTIPAEPGYLTPPGIDVVPIIKNPGAAWTRTHAFTQRFGRNGAYVPSPTVPASKTEHDRGITDGHFHYLRKDFDPVLGTYAHEAYDLIADPLETFNLLGPGVILEWETQGVPIQALSDLMTQISGL